MKKTAIACIAFLFTVFPAHPVGRNPIDLVVVLDTSSSMYSSYKEVSEYIVGPLLTEFLKIGDTFHLLSFSDAPRIEISCRIDGYEDIKTVIGRLLLMYPLDPHTDFIAALDGVYQYLRELPESRTKTVVLISDGEHSPSTGSPNAGLSADDTTKRIEASTARLKGNGWTFYFIKIPFSGKSALPKLGTGGVKMSSAAVGEKQGIETEKKSSADGSKKGITGPEKKGLSDTPKNAAGSSSAENKKETPQPVDVTEVVSETLSSPVVEWSKEDGSKNVGAAIGVVFAEFPTDLGEKSRSFSIPVKIKNPSESAMHLETASISIDGVDRMTKKSFSSLKPHSEGIIDLYVKLPDSYAAAAVKLLVAPAFAEKIRLMPDQAEVRVHIKDAPFSRFFGAAAPYIIFALGLLIAFVLLLLIVAFLKRSLTAPNRAAASAAYEREPTSKASAVPGSKSGSDDTLAKKAEPQFGTPDSRSPEAISRTAVAPSPMQGHVARLPAPLSSTVTSGTTSGPSVHGGLPTTISVPKEPKAKAKIAAVAYDYSIKKENTRIMLSLWVQDQSRSIGKRNVHLMKSGSTLSLGGGRSDFLVFLVPIPHRIADIHYDGMTCSFVPRHPEYFPDTGASVIEDCVGKTIRVVSDKGYELFLKMERYEDPLLKLNSFLHSIDTAGRV